MVALNQQPGITYWVAPNRWSALTFDEFAAAALGEASGDEDSAGPVSVVNTNSTQGRRGLRQSTPSKVDWTEQGKVTPCKNQQVRVLPQEVSQVAVGPYVHGRCCHPCHACSPVCWHTCN